MTATIPNPKFRNEYAINDLQEQINDLGGVGDLSTLTQRVDDVENAVSSAQNTANNAWSQANRAQSTADSAQSTATSARTQADTALVNANNAKAKTDKLVIGSTTSNISLGENGANSTQPFVQMSFANNQNRSLIWSDSWIELYNNNTSALMWRIRCDLMKYSSFTVKQDMRMLYLYGTFIINLSGMSVTFDGAGNWIKIATLAELRISAFIGLYPIYAACNRGYEDGYDVTVKLQGDGMYARAGGASGAYYVYGQLTGFAWALSGATPLALDENEESEPLEEDDGFMLSDDSLEFVVIGG